MSVLNDHMSAKTARGGKTARVSAPTGATKRPHLFIVTFAAWAIALAWFHPRMWSLTELAGTPVAFASIAYFVIFAEIAWLSCLRWWIGTRRRPRPLDIYPIACWMARARPQLLCCTLHATTSLNAVRSRA
jgi:hypothetical protein